jgi:hypothetical protein
VRTHDAVDEPWDDEPGDDVELGDDDPLLSDAGDFLFDDEAESDEPPPHAASTAARAPAPSRPSASRRETDVFMRVMVAADCKNFRAGRPSRR